MFGFSQSRPGVSEIWKRIFFERKGLGYILLCLEDRNDEAVLLGWNVNVILLKLFCWNFILMKLFGWNFMLMKFCFDEIYFDEIYFDEILFWRSYFDEVNLMKFYFYEVIWMMFYFDEVILIVLFWKFEYQRVYCVFIYFYFLNQNEQVYLWQSILFIEIQI